MCLREPGDLRGWSEQSCQGKRGRDPKGREADFGSDDKKISRGESEEKRKTDLNPAESAEVGIRQLT